MPPFVRRSIFLGKSYIKIFKRKLQITKRTTCDRTLCNLLAFFTICLVGIVWLNVIYLKEKMDQAALKKLPKGWKSIPSDLGSDQTAFKGVNWGKGMMWIFLLSDTFILVVSYFLI